MISRFLCRCYGLGFALVLFSSTLSFGQHDIALTELRLSGRADTTLMPLSLTTAIEVSVLNADSFSVPAGDTIWLQVEINGQSYDHVEVLSADLDPLATVDLNFGSDDLFTAPDSAAVLSCIAWARLNDDTFSLNDTLLATWHTDPALVNDWSVSDVQVLAPSNLDGFDLYNYTNIPPPLSHVTVSLLNNGPCRILQHSPMRYEIYLESDVRTFNVFLAQTITPGNTDIRQITNQAVLPVLIDSVGDYALCARTRAIAESQLANDTKCTNFSFIDSFDPTDPANWPWSVEEHVEDGIKAWVNQQQLHVENVSTNTTIQLIDLRGAVVFHKQHSGSQSFVAPTSLAPGVYILQWTDEFGRSGSLKCAVTR